MPPRKPPRSRRGTRRSIYCASALLTRAQMTLSISVSCRIERFRSAASLLSSVARQAAAAEGFRTGELSIAIIGAAAMATLHRRFLGIAGPTDVLSFDLGTDRRHGLLDGHIAVCADVALAHVRTGLRGTHRGGAELLRAARAELALYVVHGILHLAGYDDHRPADFRRMHAREDELLTQLGLGPVFAQPGVSAATRRPRARQCTPRPARSRAAVARQPAAIRRAHRS